MTVAHLLFAGGMTVYMLIAIWFEERNLVEFHGESYKSYRNSVPMLIPVFGKKERPQPVHAETLS